MKLTPHQPNILNIQFNHWLYFFIFIHILAWTLAPLCMRFTLPMDAMEGTTWGHQLEWGYDKNPFMNGWLTALAVHLDGRTGLMTYFFSQISVGISFWATWQLAKKMLLPVYALVAVLMLEGTQYYNFHAIDFNDNTLELSLWALTSLFFYQGLVENKLRDWVLTGLFAGLSMMTKYYTAMLLVPMGLFMLIQPEARERFKEKNLYIGLIVFLVAILPHTIWLFSHDFITLNYALNRVHTVNTFANHYKFPQEFTWQQILGFLPSIVLLSALLLPRRNEKDDIFFQSKICLTPFNKMFLLLIGMGPFLLTITISAILGIKLRAGWGQPLLTLWGVLMLAWLTPVISRKRFYSFITAVYALLSIMIACYCFSLHQSKKISSANFPGKLIAINLTKQWHDLYKTPLTYVTGPRWLAGNIAFYSKDDPSVFIDTNKKISPWIDEAKFKREGAIFVWDPTEEKQIPYAELKLRFPALTSLQVMHFNWLRNAKMKPIEIKVAFLPPESVQSPPQLLQAL